MIKQRFTVKKGLIILGLMILILLVLVVVSMNSGKMNLSPQEVWQVVFGKGTQKQNLIVFEFRLPRIILGILVGIGMGASGCIMQSLLRNDMASPGTLGISSGSGLFVLLYVVAFSSSSYSSAFTIPVLSFVGGMTAALLIFLLSYRKAKPMSPTGLILNGVALGSGYGALTTLLTLKLDDSQMDFVQRWYAGSLWGDDWKYLAILAPWVTILFVFVIYKARKLNVMHLGEQTATGLGLSVNKEFLGLSIAAIALSSGSVALGGNFFFVGMIAPHMARRLVGPNHKLLLPGASFAGAIIVLLADTLVRTISFGSDVPTGIVITVLSTPYFLYLLGKAS